jgi:putative transposase
MGAAGLACKTKRKFTATTDSRHDLPIAENLLDRQFTVQKTDQVYADDITYIHTKEGWLYLAVVIDLFPGKSSDGLWQNTCAYRWLLMP